MTLLAADPPSDLPSPSVSPMASPMALVSLAKRSASASSSLFRPWAAGEAASEAASEATEALVQCSPPVGICAGLSSRANRPAKVRAAPAPAAALSAKDPARSDTGAAPARPAGQTQPAQPAQPAQPILTRLEGLVATLDESSQSSGSSSGSSSGGGGGSGKGRATSSSGSNCNSGGSCPPSPARDLRTTKNRGSSSAASGRKAARSSAFSSPRGARGPKGLPAGAGPAPSAAPNVMLSLSPEEVAILAAQQQAFHEEALLAMAGLLPPPGVAPPGLGALLPPEGLPAVYLDEYARLLQQEQKAQGAAARKQRPKKYRCPHCQVAFSNNGQLRGHVRIHTGERPFKCEEESCGKRFTRNEELTRHKRIHSGQRPFACQACGKRFGRKDHLKKHTRTHDPAHRMAHMLPVLPPAHYLYGF